MIALREHFQCALKILTNVTAFPFFLFLLKGMS